jgi:menaquinone-dependent protoporphyrinogen oxidase
MPSSILVGYATNYGSTREVAERVAVTLRSQGPADGGRPLVDCRPLKEVKSLDDYRAVVIGAPLYMFRWHADAMRFLSRQQKALVARPVAVFALGPFHADAKEHQDARANLDKELRKHPWFKPVAVEVFGGKFDPAALRFPYSLIPALRNMPPSDARDWPAINAWTEGLVAQLQLQVAQVAF